MSSAYVRMSRANSLLVPKNLRDQLAISSDIRFQPIAVPTGILFRRITSDDLEVPAAKPLPETELSRLVRKDLEGDDTLPVFLKQKIIERSKALHFTKLRRS